MKKLKLLLFTILSVIVLPSMVNAASGSIKVTSTNTVVVGNKVTVTVTLSSSTSIGSWQMNLNYDKSYLKLTSSSAEAGGTVMSNSSSGTTSKKYTFTFKTLKKGSTTVSVGSYLVYAYADMSEMNINVSSKNIKIITQEELEASYSKDNNLRSLEIEGYEIAPVFSKDVTEYSVTVPEGTKEVNVLAKANDSKASVSGDGNIEVSEGANNVVITVRAENGSEKTYTLVVNVIDQNPINVRIDGKEYSVVKLRESYSCPELYNESTVSINGIDVPSCRNDKTNFTLVGLRNANNEVFSYIYSNNEYKRYTELVGTSIKIINEKFEGSIVGLKEDVAKIDGEEYQVFKLNDNSRFYVVYGMNVETGEKDFYLYDTENKTFSVYDTEQIDYLKEQNKLYLYVIIAFGAGLLLSLICIIILIKNNKSKKKSNNKKLEVKKEKIKDKKEPVEENKIEEVNEVKETNNEEDKTDTYYLFENDKKKSNKKK